MERIDEGQPYMVLVDYAHTPDGLQNVLRTLKDIALKRQGRLLVLFGCGGNRACLLSGDRHDHDLRTGRSQRWPRAV